VDVGPECACGRKRPAVMGSRPLRVGMVGYSFMGAAHSHAWRTAPRFFDLPLAPELTALAGRNPVADPLFRCWPTTKQRVGNVLVD
jgi:hypothetical protein